MLKIATGMVYLVFLSFLLFVSRVSTLNSLPMVRDPNLAKIQSFDVYWNIPTFLCEKHGIKFPQTLSKYGIEANSGDKFRGEKISLFYDPGFFPIYLKDKESGEFKEVNGGIPQRGNLEKHLEEFEKVLQQQLPSDYSGLAVIDFEFWRPIFRQHWNEQLIYKNMSLKYAEEKNPSLSGKQLEAEAKKQFEASARNFLENTLKKARNLRPNAKWGYYGFPYCLNYGKNNSADCPQMVKEENDEIFWLFQNSNAFYLSVYSSSNLNKEDHKYFVTARMNEAARMAAKVSTSNPPQIFPYLWYRHNDNPAFIKKEIMETILKTIKDFQLGGVIIWGSSSELKTENECSELHTYLEKVLGPAILKVKNS